MASATALTLVNRILLTSGDLPKLTTLINSPAEIADRIINIMNLVVADIGRAVDLPILKEVFSSLGDGINSVWTSVQGTGLALYGITSCSVDGILLEYKTTAQYIDYAKKNLVGVPSIYKTGRAPTGELQVHIYPTPPIGALIIVNARNDPSPFVLNDASTTQLTGIDDIIVLGSLMHLDAYDGLNRGYTKLYEAAKNKLFTHSFRNDIIRVQPEDYS